MLGIVGYGPGANHGKKVGMRADANQDEKRTNEMGAVIPLLDTLADHLLKRRADRLFTVKGIQKPLQDDIAS